jgi:hypothetical protein
MAISLSLIGGVGAGLPRSLESAGQQLIPSPSTVVGAKTADLRHPPFGQKIRSMFVPRPIFYLWALPTTAVGLLFVPVALLSGGGMRLVQGVVEIHGGLVRLFLEHCTLLKGGASAMTLGHVVIGRSRDVLDQTRSHERIHVRQCERWGPLFIPAYLGASLIIWARGGQPYLDNPFEREAYGNQL